MKWIPVEEKAKSLKITGNVDEKARPIITKILIAIDRGEIPFEEYEPTDDGTFVKTEYCGSWKKFELSLIKKIKCGGINPRFNFNIFCPNGDTIQLRGEVAAYANKLMKRSHRMQADAKISDKSIDELVSMLGDE